jgi:uncharacterized protein involved in exopolysaccharide biosynthesis
VFRRKRAILICFAGVLLGTVLVLFVRASEYTASAKIMLRRERLDPAISPSGNTQSPPQAAITEEELNSQIELMQSEDVLRRVVVACGLENRRPLWAWVDSRDHDKRLARAVSRLRDKLKIEPIKKSDLISISYTSADPHLSAGVLSALTDAYLQKHVAVSSPPGRSQFFDEEAQRYHKQLLDAEAEMKAFSDRTDGVAPQLARDLTLQKLKDFQASLQESKAELAANADRIRTLEHQGAITPQRLTTQARRMDDPQVLQSLKSTLTTLEMKRIELLTRYQATYPLVREVDQQIQKARTALAAEETNPLREETTDRNPTYSWLDAELAKARADYTGLQARTAATSKIVSRYTDDARALEQQGMVQQDLVRAVKINEENYLLYERKLEEARMSDALDRSRILNVTVADPPTTPVLPSNPPWITFIVGTTFAIVVSLGLAVLLERMDPSFVNPRQVAAHLNIPVLAAVPTENLSLPGNYSQRKVPYTPELPKVQSHLEAD